MKIEYDIFEEKPGEEFLLGGFKKDLEIDDLQKFSKEFDEFIDQYRKESFSKQNRQTEDKA